MYATTIGGRSYSFADLKAVLGKAGPERSGDQLAGVAAESDEERVAARSVLADLPLSVFLEELVVPYESDEVTRLIVDTHDTAAFAPVAHLTVGGFRDWLLSYEATSEALTALAPGLTPEMVAAVSKMMRNQDLVAGRAQVPGRDPVPHHRSGCRGGSRCGCSPTTPPTTRAASPPRSSTGCSTAAATR